MTCTRQSDRCGSLNRQSDRHDIHSQHSLGDSTMTQERPADETPESPPASVQPPVRSRLLPQYSFRTVMIGTAALALAAFVYRQSMLGAVWAEALVFASATILCCFVGFAFLFLIAWIPALIGRDSWEDVAKGNPFADGQLPPQLLPPTERKL
jgi:hypothetical protein